MQLYRFNNRTWFGIAVGVLIIGTLLFSFALIFNWLPKSGNLGILWEVIRFTLAALVLISWGILNVTAPRPPGFVIAFAEFGEEYVETGADYGMLRPERKRLVNLLNRDGDEEEDEESLALSGSKFLAELRRNRKANPTGALPASRTARALASGKPNTPANTTALALAERRNRVNAASENGYNGSNGANHGNGRAGGPLARSGNDTYVNEFGEIEKRPPSRIKFQPPESFFAWEEAVGANHLTDYLQGKFVVELQESDLKEGVSLYPLVFVKSREAALREADVPQADMVVWGWKVYRRKRDFVPVFELRQPLEVTRPAIGPMEIMGIKSFELGVQTARRSTLFTAFLAGLGAYGYAGEAKEPPLYYRRAIDEFNLALTTSYMYNDRAHYQDAVERSIIYFFLGNSYYYLNNLEHAANSYREALAVDNDMYQARHNLAVVLFLQNKFDAAIKSMVKVIQAEPTRALPRLNLGIVYMAQKQYNSARREFQNSIKLDSRLVGAYRALGISYREEQDYDKALNYLEEALQLAPGNKYPEAHVDMALVYAQIARADDTSEGEAYEYYRQATEQLQQAIAENPNLPDAHFQLGRLLYDGGEEDAATEHLLDAVRLRPDLSDAHQLLADIYESRGRLDLRDKHLELMMKARQASAANTPKELVQRAIGLRLNKQYENARDELEKALKMDPRNSEALYEMGIVYQEMDEPDKALNTFQIVLRLPEPPVEVYNRISNIKFQQDDRQGALELLRQAVQSDPNNARLNYYLGNAYRKQRTDGKAIESYIRAIQLEPDMAEPHFNLGMIYLNRRQINDAILQFREVVRIRPEDYETHLFLGRAYRQANQIDQAVSSIEEAISLKSDLLEARLLLAEIYLRQAEPERAIEQLTFVQTYNPKDLRARELMGKAYAQAGQLDRAIETFQDIIVVAPDSVSGHYNLGVSFVAQKRYREAIREFIEVIRYKPDDYDSFFGMGVAIHELLNGPDQGSLTAAQLDEYFNQEVQSFSHAIKLQPTNPEPYRYLGQLYTRTNNIELAMKYLNEYGRLKKQG